MSTTTLGISQFPFAANSRREPAPAPSSSRDNSFLTALIDTAEKQTREKAIREELAAAKAAQEVARNAAEEAARNAIRKAARQPAHTTAEEDPADEFLADEPLASGSIDVPAVIRQVRPPLHTVNNPLLRAFSWLNRKYTLSATKQLRVAETVSLGEKRFVAVVHVAGQKFLIGGGAQGVSLLTQLDAPTDPQTAAAVAGDAE